MTRPLPLPLLEPPPSRFVFPNPRVKRSDQGVVCIGGDFAPGTLLAAYRRGIFPWPVSATMVPWCSPDPRAVFPLDRDPRASWGSSMNRARRRAEFRITFDEAFVDVMEGCGDREEGTWIVKPLVDGFVELHERGFAHSIEVWNRQSGELVGGLYGLAVGGLFAGESMFSRERDASKHAFAHLTEHLFHAGFRLLDAQVMNPHLASLGMQELDRDSYLDQLPNLLRLHPTFPVSPPR
jgi:leucyl/phenylalanyl-tRNA---protein transferase